MFISVSVYFQCPSVANGFSAFVYLLDFNGCVNMSSMGCGLVVVVVNTYDHYNACLIGVMC